MKLNNWAIQVKPSRPHKREGFALEDIGKIREKFPVTKNKIFMNHAAQSPLPKPVADSIHSCVDEISRSGYLPSEWQDMGKPEFAELINAKTEEIALVENTSMGMNIAANMLRFPPGAKIVTTDLEYPAAVYPFLRKGINAKVYYVKNVNGEIRLEDMEKAVDDSTAAVAVSHVEYVNGFRHDLGALSKIAHEHGAYLIVDAIQSAGVMPIDVRKDNVDFLTTACYKWLLSPPGAAYLYVKEELIGKFEPPFAGWASVKQEVFNTVDFYDIWKLELSDTATRFEVGSPSSLSFVGAKQAIRMLLDFGIDNIEKRVLKLTNQLLQSVKDFGLKLQTPESEKCRSGIVNFKTENPQQMVKMLGDEGIVISARANGLRVSPHFYNTEEEISKLMEEIKHSS